MLADGCFYLKWQVFLTLLGIAFTAHALSAPAQLKLENELLLELRLDGEKLGLDVLGYQRGEDFLLSLAELTSGLGFAIAVDASNGTANGWYISADRGFSLDLDSATVTSSGKQWPLAEGEAVVFQGDLYVETNALQKWFPLQLSAVVRELFLDAQATEPLPIQQRFKRRDKVFSQSGASLEAQHPLQQTPYQLLGPHITRLRFGYSTVRRTPDNSAEYGTNHALLSRGDLGWMTSTLSLAGQSGDSVTAARVKLERTAFQGPLGLNHIEIGDVDAEGFRGVLLRSDGKNAVEGGRFDNEAVTLEGSQLPDWDVELYQNDQLIAIQTTGQDGRYLFEDVPLLFGENRFELRFFGPFGETESREEFHFLGAGMLDPGYISYEMAAVQSGRTVLGVNDANGEGDLDSIIYTSGFNLGLSRNLTAGAGVRSLTKDGARRDSRNVSLGLITSRFFGNVRYLDVDDSQNSVNTSLRTRLGGTSINLGYSQFLNEPGLASSSRKWGADMDITSVIFDVPIKFDASRQEQEGSSVFNAVLGATTSLWDAGRFSSSLWYSTVESRLDGVTTNTSQTGGQSSFHTVIRPWAFRFSASYGFEPEGELMELSADSSLHIDRDLSLDLNLRKNATSDTTYYTGGINWQLDQLAINARVSYDSNETWSGLITLSTGLVHKPSSLIPRLDSRLSVGTGSAVVRVTEETDGAERKPHAGVEVNGVQVWRKATTNEAGEAYLYRLPAHRQVDIELDEHTIADGEFRSKKPGISIIPRPGSFAVVEFPIVRTAELEGHIIVADGLDNQPLSRALVQLRTVDGEVVAQRRTAFDGFYLFDGIEPGVYEITLEEALAKRVLDQPGTVTLQNSDELIQGLDFKLSAIPAKSIVPTTGAQEEILQQASITLPTDAMAPTLASAVPESDSPTAQPPQTGTWFVQLGAYASRSLAQSFWDRVTQGLSLFQGKTPEFTQYQDMTRLLVGPGSSREAANEFCQQLKADNIDCLTRKLE